MFKRFTGDTPPLWQQTYNLVDSKIFRISRKAYEQANPPGKKKHVPYHLPDEVRDMIKFLNELGPETSRERCEEMVAFATSPGVNQLIYGAT